MSHQVIILIYCSSSPSLPPTTIPFIITARSPLVINSWNLFGRCYQLISLYSPAYSWWVLVSYIKTLPLIWYIFLTCDYFFRYTSPSLITYLFITLSFLITRQFFVGRCYLLNDGRKNMSSNKKK